MRTTSRDTRNIVKATGFVRCRSLAVCFVGTNNTQMFIQFVLKASKNTTVQNDAKRHEHLVRESTLLIISPLLRIAADLLLSGTENGISIYSDSQNVTEVFRFHPENSCKHGLGLVQGYKIMWGASSTLYKECLSMTQTFSFEHNLLLLTKKGKQYEQNPILETD